MSPTRSCGVRAVQWNVSPTFLRCASSVSMPVRLSIGRERLPEADHGTHRIQDKCDARNARHDEWIDHNPAAKPRRSPGGVLDVVHPHIGCPMRCHPVIQKGLSELVDGADVVIGQAKTCEAASVRQLLMRRPAEQIAIKHLCATGVGGSKVEPTKLSGICFAKVYHGATLMPCRPTVPPFAGNGRAAPGNQVASVIGSRTVRTSVIFVAGKPLSLACSFTAASLSAR